MDERNNHFDFDFTPIGQAIKKAREAKGMTREQLSGIIGYAPDTSNLSKTRGSIQALSCLFNLLRCSMCRLTSTYSQIRKLKKVLSADA